MRPPGRGRDREVLVGLFVMLGIFVIGIFSMRITDSPVFRSGTEFTVFLSDANGIFENSKVKIAGISVGVVREIRLEGGKAKLKILLDKGYKIERGSFVLPRSQGILGDRFLEIVLPRDPTEIENIKKEGAEEYKEEFNSSTEDSQSSGALLNGIEKLFAWVIPVAHAQQNYQAGEVIPAQPATASTDDVMRKLGDIGDDVKVLARDLKELVRENKAEVSAAIKSIRRSADSLDLILKDLSQKNTREDLKETIKGLRESVDSIKAIAERVNKGEGSIGKLINDPQAADQLVRALNSIVEFLDRARRTQIIVDMNSNYLMGSKKTKTHLNLQIMPRSSYGYLVGIVQDPGGKRTTVEEEVSVGGAPPVKTKTVKIEKSAFEFNLQFVRKVYFTTFRLGLFESSGGLGVDLELWKDHFFITGEVFDFGRENENAHVRLLARLQFLETFYIQGGYEELAAKSSQIRDDSLFFGLGLRFNDDDLKNFLVFFGGF